MQDITFWKCWGLLAFIGIGGFIFILCFDEWDIRPALVKDIEQAETSCDVEFGGGFGSTGETVVYDPEVDYWRNRCSKFERIVSIDFSIIYKNIDVLKFKADDIRGIDPDWIDYVDWKKAAKEIRAKYDMGAGEIDFGLEALVFKAKEE